MTFLYTAIRLILTFMIFNLVRRSSDAYNDEFSVGPAPSQARMV